MTPQLLGREREWLRFRAFLDAPGRVLALHGGPGSGKRALVAAALQHAVHLGRPCLRLSAADSALGATLGERIERAWPEGGAKTLPAVVVVEAWPEGQPHDAAPLVERVAEHPEWTWIVVARRRVPFADETIRLGGLDRRGALALLHRAAEVHGAIPPRDPRLAGALLEALGGLPGAIHWAAEQLLQRTMRELVVHWSELLFTEPAHLFLQTMADAWGGFTDSEAQELGRLAALPAMFGATLAATALESTESFAAARCGEWWLRGWLERVEPPGASAAVFRFTGPYRNIARQRAPGAVLDAEHALLAWLDGSGRSWWQALRGDAPHAARRAACEHAELIEVAVEWAAQRRVACPGLWLAADVAAGAGRCPVEHGRWLDMSTELAGQDPAAVAIGFGLRSRFHFLRGSYTKAEEDCTIATRAVDSLGVATRPWITSLVHRVPSPVAWALGDPQRALKLAQETTNMARTTGNAPLRRASRHNEGTALLRGGDWAGAREVFLELVREMEPATEPLLCGTVLANLGFLERDAGRLHLAREYAEKAATALHGVGELALLAKVLRLLAQLEWLELERNGGDNGLTHARHALEGAEAAARAVNDREGLVLLALGRARLEAHAGGSPDRALATARVLASTLDETTLLSAVEGAERELATGQEPPLVAADGAWVWPVGGARTELSHRPALHGVLRALMKGSGEEHDVDALFAEGWPGQRALPHSAANRVYAAIRALRRAGLSDAIVRQGHGYALRPERVRVARDDTA